MHLIPVIDLMRGQVVRAVRGDRASYRPIVSTLCAGSDPVTVARALCAHCASARLYAADLDALTGGHAQAEVLRRILRALPELEFWVDAGFADADAAQRLCEQVGEGAERIVPIFASESLRSREELARCFADREAGVLSLDRRDGRRLDAAGCWDTPALWPSRVIVMTLERVGADAGPDLATLREVQARSPATQLVGAGGIRHVEDLAAAREAGAYAWLVASALHDGRLPPVRPSSP
ncbi:HisA/HisF-related TIM barrel protein [uncultured Piscinibacter sp.]|uniref:HisA/HisF-related TIM barrel protein n=1 Tax=uncultured Piscinibacter sp. TaxID=1131835 RepID=UPI002621CC24|nr:HisA/HisF-related TIM barrel protein [uncultured Piscinibacter sp.]